MTKESETSATKVESEDELKGGDTAFLADLQRDPGQTTNLRAKYPKVVAELTRLVRQWRREAEH